MLVGGLVPDQESFYKVSVHNVGLDAYVASMKTTFAQHGELFADFSYLEPNNLSEIKSLPVIWNCCVGDRVLLHFRSIFS